MSCKNCKSELDTLNNFCSECGAKVVRERITIKSIIQNILFALGWDSNFFVTLRHLLYKPHVVFKEYANGTRKKYADPFTFFAISLAISLFTFNQYSEKFIEMSTATNMQQLETMDNESLSVDKNESKGLKLLGFDSQEEFSIAIMEFQLKYYNIISFLYLPLFTLIAFLVFRKPYNYGEHLVFNTYISSITTFIGVLLFVFSLFTGINILLYATFVTFFYYSFVYKKLYELSLGKLILKILKFVFILLLFVIVFAVIGFIVAMIVSKI